MGLDGSSVLDECRFIPLRLDERERGLLAMLKGALNVSEYTDQVDRYSRWGTTSKTINSELRRALAALSGMVAAGKLYRACFFPSDPSYPCPNAIPVWSAMEVNFPNFFVGGGGSVDLLAERRLFMGKGKRGCQFSCSSLRVQSRAYASLLSRCDLTLTESREFCSRCGRGLGCGHGSGVTESATFCHQWCVLMLYLACSGGSVLNCNCFLGVES